ncbi:MAG: hypothetical protein IKI83_09520 [Prevotella sp.]|nr:hypothetical protein [Prevotella sp.]
MATDIWIHIEHRSRKSGKFVYDFKPDSARVYALFGALAGTRGSLNPIYDPRGLPIDASPEVIEEHDLFEEDAHTESWLTTGEFRECLDLMIKELSNNYDLKEIKTWLKSYEWIYEYMKSSEDEGEPSRIVFWFDN